MIPHSIYEIEGGREVAIEFRSFSKNAGFTGLRCGYIVLPKELKGRAASGEEVDLHRLWARRHSTKFNGVAYPVQRGAAAAYSPAGRQGIAERVAFYMENAAIMRQQLGAAGLTVYGGEHAPYLWVVTPTGRIAGPISTTCSTRPTSSARRVRVLARLAKDTCACRPSITATGSKRPWSGLASSRGSTPQKAVPPC